MESSPRWPLAGIPVPMRRPEHITAAHKPPANLRADKRHLRSRTSLAAVRQPAGLIEAGLLVFGDVGHCILGRQSRRQPS